MQLFSLSLNAIKSLNLTLRSIDPDKGVIIVADKFRNTFVVLISKEHNSESKVKILGYSSRLGKSRDLLDKTLKNLLIKINET